jgi:hypothetical protein
MPISVSNSAPSMRRARQAKCRVCPPRTAWRCSDQAADQRHRLAGEHLAGARVGIDDLIALDDYHRIGGAEDQGSGQLLAFLERFQCAAQIALARRHRCRHRGEGLREISDLIGARSVERGAMLAGGDCAGGFGELAERPLDAQAQDHQQEECLGGDDESADDDDPERCRARARRDRLGGIEGDDGPAWARQP